MENVTYKKRVLYICTDSDQHTFRHSDEMKRARDADLTCNSVQIELRKRGGSRFRILGCIGDGEKQFRHVASSEALTQRLAMRKGKFVFFVMRSFFEYIKSKKRDVRL